MAKLSQCKDLVGGPLAGWPDTTQRLASLVLRRTPLVANLGRDISYYLFKR
jgi:hypothetical protein